MRKLGLFLLFVVAACEGDCEDPSIDEGVVGHGIEFFAEGEGVRKPLRNRGIDVFEGGLDEEGSPEGERVLTSVTDECGLFQLALEPGDYSLCPVDCLDGLCLEVTVGTGTVEYEYTVDLGNCSWEQVG